ncbi:hypothetical protein [uncultured Parvibaculum sp.]|uniref:hypothetical protein n=1 Tax=uncultured Parvibaculum sp. TaxID=291828 RepID=UPI0030DC940E|tara:strand:- start:54881 stop:55171 length:291 start_codon:yes stop_codon:yes gene_type:complete
MKVAKTTLILLALLALAACASPQEQAARAAAQTEADAAECERLGFTPGTEAFASCQLKLKEIRAQEANTQALRRAQTPPPFWGPWPGYYPYPYRRW